MSMSDVKRIKYKSGKKIAFIADDIKDLNKFGLFHNATFSLMLASCKLGAKLFLAGSKSLKVRNGKVSARFYEVNVKQEYRNHITILRSFECGLDAMDVVFARKDPPVNEDYLSFIYKLCLVSRNKNSKTLIVNNPEGILKANEKLYAFNFPDIIPPTLVTTSEIEAFRFLNKYKEVVIKPLFNKSGKGVFYVNKKKKTLIKKSLLKYGTIIVQKYLKQILYGDKRIIVLNGNPIGAVKRIPRKGEFRTNVCYGPKFVPYKLQNSDFKICKLLKPFLLKDGLYFVGIDVIGKYLIEINLTCPATLQETSRADKNDLASKIIEWAIKR